MISPDTAVTFEKFTQNVKRAIQARSKDVRIEINDANLLMTEIANVVARLAVLEHHTAKEATSMSVSMDGGGFKG